METSQDIKEIAVALVKVQGALVKAKTDSENPHFRSKYADLESVWDACHHALQLAEVAVIQGPGVDDNGCAFVETMLLHKSGQFIKSRATARPNSLDPQKIGLTTTYLRRYGLAAMVGVVQEDDDGDGDRKDKDSKKPISSPSSEMPAETKSKPKATRGVDTIKQIDQVASGDTVESLLGELAIMKTLGNLEAWGTKNSELIKKLTVEARDTIRSEYARKKSEFESIAA